MIHLGDITKINGAEIEAVDVITAGSPCQDLSVADRCPSNVRIDKNRLDKNRLILTSDDDEEIEIDET